MTHNNVDKYIINNIITTRLRSKQLSSGSTKNSTKDRIDDINNTLNHISKLKIDITMVKQINNLIEMYHCSGNPCIIQEIESILDEYIH